MKYLYLLAFTFLLYPSVVLAQNNIVVTNAEVDAVLKGMVDPSIYLPTEVINHPATIAADLVESVSADSLRSYLEKMSSFGTRNSGSDTTSNTTGMGAARRWAFDKFQSFSPRLLTSYLQFDLEICGMDRHRNVLAALPGVGPHHDEIVFIEGHFDSRCEDRCDVDCPADGMEDNGSGSALVLELARVMSAYTFDRTIVFMLTTAEEQGLLGAQAMADYCDAQDVNVIAVLNNDIVGGIICGQTASPPGCPGLNHIDSLNVRLYSAGNLNSRHKMLSRFVKLEYQEMLSEIVPVPSLINIMSPEDRSGRGGDHIPFRQNGFPAIRFTSANEHGNGDPATPPSYEDRQHTIEDILGLDTDNDGILDSFFVDFNYLARNVVINANAAAMIAAGPEPPTDLDLTPIDSGFEVAIEASMEFDAYRVGVRQFTSRDFDTVYTIQQPLDTLYGLTPDILYVISVATVDSNGVESLFYGERFNDFESDVIEAAIQEEQLELLQNRPNPFDEATYFGVWVKRVPDYRQARIEVHNLQGQLLTRLPIRLDEGLNEVLYDFSHHQYQPGMYTYSLVVDDRTWVTKRMIYAY